MHIEIEGGPEPLDEGDDAGSGPAFAGETGTVDEVGLDGPNSEFVADSKGYSNTKSRPFALQCGLHCLSLL